MQFDTFIIFLQLLIITLTYLLIIRFMNENDRCYILGEH